MEGFRSLMTYCFLLSLSLSPFGARGFIFYSPPRGRDGNQDFEGEKMYIQTRVSLFP